jgi:hypothetical protein
MWHNSNTWGWYQQIKTAWKKKLRLDQNHAMSATVSSISLVSLFDIQE